MNEILEMIDFLGELDYDLHNNMSSADMLAVRERIHRYKNRLEAEVNEFESSIEETKTKFYSLTTDESETIL
jgi:hypothetical protein